MSRKRSHNITLAFLRRLSIREDLRVTLPNGKSVRAYWTDEDRTRVRAETSSGGRRRHLYGRYVRGRLVPKC